MNIFTCHVCPAQLVEMTDGHIDDGTMPAIVVTWPAWASIPRNNVFPIPGSDHGIILPWAWCFFNPHPSSHSEYGGLVWGV